MFRRIESSGLSNESARRGGNCSTLLPAYRHLASTSWLVSTGYDRLVLSKDKIRCHGFPTLLGGGPSGYR